MRAPMLVFMVVAMLAGCKEDSANKDLPEAATLTEEAAGYYCQMIILEHQGPKAQMHLDGYPAPIWFSQVRDGIAYLKSPEQAAEILVFYVNDMARAQSWEKPGAENWINADEAYFVVGSDAVGGMGAPEIAPFGNQASAEQFARERGGEVMRLKDIPAEIVLSPVEFNSITEGHPSEDS